MGGRGKKKATKKLTIVAGFHMSQTTPMMDYVGNTDPDSFVQVFFCSNGPGILFRWLDV